MKAIRSERFDRIVVSTESSDVAKEAERYGVDVPFLRPGHLSVDPSTLIDVMLHTLQYFDEIDQDVNSVTLVLPTTPFVSVADIKDAMDLYASSPTSSVLSVTEYEHAIYNAWQIAQDEQEQGVLEPCFPDSPYKFTKSTECPKAYRANGGVLVTNAALLKADKTYRGRPILPLVMPSVRSVDIDTSFDFELARFLSPQIEHDWL
jgi:CMP-N-acetylneuraminic acid synthetase